MITVSLRVVVAVVILLVAGGMVALIVTGSETAEKSVEDVALGLPNQVSQRVTDHALDVVAIPFRGMKVMQNVYKMGLANPERADAFGFKDVLQYNRLVRMSIDDWGNSFYTGTENGHIYNGLGEVEGGLNKMMLQPPLDQIIEGFPTWTIPCRYQ